MFLELFKKCKVNIDKVFNSKTRIRWRWPLLFWFGVLFCFFIFPLFLVDVGLDSYLETRKDLQRKQRFKQMNNRLEMLLQYGNSRHYYHALLKRITDFAQESEDPIAYLRRALSHLKKVNPGVFKFIVWDKKGKTVKDLTDETRYRYIVRTIYRVFVKTAQDCRQNYPGIPEEIDLVQKRLHLIRSYLGAFFIPERLNLPYLRGILGECIMASANPKKSHFWHRVKEKFALFATIHIKAIDSPVYLKKLVDSLNKNNGVQMKCGIAQLLKDDEVYTSPDFAFKEELLIELGKFLDSSETEVETDNLLLVIKPVTPFVLGFCALPVKNNLIDIKSARTNILILTIFLMAAIGLIIAYVVFKNDFFSIRWKLALLFIYANGLPLLILGFLGFEYLQQTRMQLLDKGQKQVSDLLNNMDSKFEIILDEYGREINEICDNFNQKFIDGETKQKDIDELAEKILAYKTLDLIIADSSGDFRAFHSPGRKTDSFIKNVGKNLIKYANRKTYTPVEMFDDAGDAKKGESQSQALMRTDAIVFDQILRKIRMIDYQQMAAEERLYYWNFLGNISKRKIEFMVMLSWRCHELQETFIKKYLDDFNQNKQGIRFYAMVENNGLTFPLDDVPDAIENLFRKTFNLKVFRTDMIEVNDKNFTAYASVGKLMNKIAFVGIYPLDSINSHIEVLTFQLIIFAFLSLSLTSGIGLMLARQFIEPVKELENGVKAIGEQNFRYRIPVRGEDEFGHLSTVFNQAIESLEDLEVARIVQENLFPLKPLKQHGVEVFGKSVSMTRLGGDYFDYFSLDKDRVGILMGDVAGHGVPAAL
ncbi:MAG: PP2C family protein-serine/threonine phosphatase, partial [Candidatus Rifleibacteriota bacterium]